MGGDQADSTRTESSQIHVHLDGVGGDICLFHDWDLGVPAVLWSL